ncbi:MAG: prepilin-type N-terminal cleavage/methylation domain-containing protein [Tepidisphaeraceae bacterium]|jgi:prepilin-type N-terminal cleavage/methylation domain-containing protein/prepilin-type processing-associated H-X9-DG protein
MSLRRKAFTLVELLVVIGIIVLLISILLPVLTRAKEAAARTVCASNMRQLGMVFLQYHADAKGYLPCAGHDPDCGGIGNNRAWVAWYSPDAFDGSLIKQYLSKGTTYKLLLCPSDDPMLRGRRTFAMYYPYSYVLNDTVFMHWSHWDMNPPKMTILRPSEKILAIEENSAYIDKGSFEVAELRQFKGDLLSNRHGSNRGNVLFGDGHCDFVDRGVFTRAAAEPGTTVQMGTNEYAQVPDIMNPHAR